MEAVIEFLTILSLTARELQQLVSLRETCQPDYTF